MPSPSLSVSADTCPHTTVSQSDGAISALTMADLPAVAALHDAVFGPGRFARTAYRIREGASALSPACCKLEIDGVLRGAVQMTWISVGAGCDQGMLLGPLAVYQDYANIGYGQTLIAAAVTQAERYGAAYVILVGDLPYYEKTGFERVPMHSVSLPGPVDPTRLLIRRLRSDVAMPSGDLRAVR